MAIYDPYAEHFSNPTLEEISALTGQPIEEIKQDVLDGWVRSDNYRLHEQAVLEGGKKEWRALVNDESTVVRMAIAKVADEVVCLRLIEDPEPSVRAYLAQYQTDPIRLALVEANEPDQYVMEKIMQYGNSEVKRAMIASVIERPADLMPLIKYAVSSDIKSLISYPNQSIRVEAAQYASRADCLRVLNEPGIGAMKLFLEAHMEDLDELSLLLHPNEQKTVLKGQPGKEPELFEPEL